ncbi:hypothetical protein PIB30_094531, partial [Stylosanthes scabra]|nr:hypothetical protein [Stylosanthes scabra]
GCEKEDAFSDRAREMDATCECERVREHGERASVVRRRRGGMGEEGLPRERSS